MASNVKPSASACCASASTQESKCFSTNWKAISAPWCRSGGRVNGCVLKGFADAVARHSATYGDAVENLRREHEKNRRSLDDAMAQTSVDIDELTWRRRHSGRPAAAPFDTGGRNHGRSPMNWLENAAWSTTSAERAQWLRAVRDLRAARRARRRHHHVGGQDGEERGADTACVGLIGSPTILWEVRTRERARRARPAPCRPPAALATRSPRSRPVPRGARKSAAGGRRPAAIGRPARGDFRNRPPMRKPRSTAPGCAEPRSGSWKGGRAKRRWTPSRWPARRSATSTWR